MNFVAKPAHPRLPSRARSSGFWVSMLLVLSLLAKGGIAISKPAAEAPVRWLPADALAAYAIDFAALRSSPRFGDAMEFFKALGESGPVHTDRASGLHPSEQVDRVAAVFLESGHTLYAIEGAKLDEKEVRAFFASNAPADRAPVKRTPVKSPDKRQTKDGVAPSKSDAKATADPVDPADPLDATSAGKPPPASTPGEPIVAHDGMLVAFVKDHTALVGKPADVRKTLQGGAAAWAKGAAQRGKLWKARLSDVALNQPFWFDSRAPGKKSRWVMPSRLEGLRRAFGSATLDSDAHIEVKLRCDRADACERLSDQLVKERDEIRGRIALRLAGVGAIADGIVVEHQGKSIDVSATWTSGQLRSLLGLGPKLLRLMRR